MADKSRPTTVALESLSLAQLAEMYNLAIEKGEPQIKKFKDRPTGLARLRRALDAAGFEVFAHDDGELDLRVSSSQVDPTEDAPRGGGRVSPLLGRKLKLVRRDNPKRKGSATHRRYELYAICKTTDEYMARCTDAGLGSRREVLSDLAYDRRMGFIQFT